MERTSPTLCPECSCPIQRTNGGTVQDGLAAHYATVHPGMAVPA